MASKQPPSSSRQVSRRSGFPAPTLSASTPFVLGDLIGKGSFATVYKGQLKESGKSVAIKVVHRAHLKRDKRLLDNFEAEMAILKQMKHPHVVSLIDVFQTDDDFHLVMEYCSLGDLCYLIRKRNQLVKTMPLVSSLFERYPATRSGGLNETVVRHILAQLASALSFLRDHNLVHRDIKPQNLLLKPPSKSLAEAQELGYAGLWELPVLKVADFGFARFLPSTSMAETLCGSPLYMAPEILRYEKYNAKADLWSVGAVAFEMATGKPPFPAANHMDLIKKIEDAKDDIKFPDHEAAPLSPNLKQVIRGLLKRSPAERMGFDEFFKHPALEVTGWEQPLDLSNLDGRMYISEYIKQDDTPSKPSEATTPKWTARASPASTPRNSPSPTQLSPQASAREESVGRRSSSPRYSPPPRVRKKSQGHNREVPNALTSSIIPEQAVSSSGESLDSKSPRGKREGGDSGVMDLSSSLDRDYVVVEKRTVEVNALADDLATSPNDRRASQNSTVRRRLSSISYGTSPTNALAQALLKSSARLFGTRIDTGGVSFSAAADITGITPRRQTSLFRRSGASDVTVQTEFQLVQELEKLAAMGKVVSLFADVKYAQLNEIGDGAASAPQDPTVQDVVAQEALALYLKALSIFAAAMDKAAIWWSHNETGVASTRINNLVQWIRDKFNEAVDRGEASRVYILDGSGYDSHSTGPIFSVEKLLFDRALEMSRAAAVQELSSDDLVTSEMNYGTALWMLRALIESEKSEDSLDDDDRELVERLLAKIAQRLVSLRRRLDTTSTSVSRSLSPVSP